MAMRLAATGKVQVVPFNFILKDIPGEEKDPDLGFGVRMGEA